MQCTQTFETICSVNSRHIKNFPANMNYVVEYLLQIKKFTNWQTMQLTSCCALILNILMLWKIRSLWWKSQICHCGFMPVPCFTYHYWH